MPANVLPGVITHNYHPDGAFLANLCDLPPGDAEAILQRHRDVYRWPIKANYLRRRLETEAWLIGERQRLLGRTQRLRPIYFFLGDFADGKDPRRPCSLVIPLDAFLPDMLTFTYPDSMASLPIGRFEKLQRDRKPYHGKVFTLSEIGEIVKEFGLPEADPATGVDRFIEVQVWDDRPILSFLRGQIPAGDDD